VLLLLAYAFLAGVMVWALGRRGGPWVLQLSERGQQGVRLAVLTLDVAVGAIGIAVLGLQLGDHAHVLGWIIGGAVSLGSILYAAGLLAWRGDRALGLRVLGWVLMLVAFVLPSTLTVGLPVVALLAVAPERGKGRFGRRGARKPAAGVAPPAVAPPAAASAAATSITAYPKKDEFAS